MQLDTPLMQENQPALDMSRTLPWAIELKNGVRCLRVESVESLEGLSIHYHCTDNAQLVGDAYRCHPEWTILKHDASGTYAVSIDAAWF